MKTINSVKNKILDIYFNAISTDIENSKVAPPILKIMKSVDNIGSDEIVYVYYLKEQEVDIQPCISFKVTKNKHTSSDKYELIGTIKYSDYMSLERIIDATLAGYRSKHFKRISHRQRHTQEDK